MNRIYYFQACSNSCDSVMTYYSFLEYSIPRDYFYRTLTTKNQRQSFYISNWNTKMFSEFFYNNSISYCVVNVVNEQYHCSSIIFIILQPRYNWRDSVVTRCSFLFSVRLTKIFFFRCLCLGTSFFLILTFAIIYVTCYPRFLEPSIILHLCYCVVNILSLCACIFINPSTKLTIL